MIMGKFWELSFYFHIRFRVQFRSVWQMLHVTMADNMVWNLECFDSILELQETALLTLLWQ